MPGLAAVEAQVHAAVVAADHPPGIERVDPEIVMVAVVEASRLLERLAPVDALEHRHARGVVSKQAWIAPIRDGSSFRRPDKRPTTDQRAGTNTVMEMVTDPVNLGQLHGTC